MRIAPDNGTDNDLVSIASSGGQFWPSIPTWRDIKAMIARGLVHAGLALAPERNLVAYARSELVRDGRLGSDYDYDHWVAHSILELVKLFALQGHSGFSAEQVAAGLSRLAVFNPLTALTDTPEDWMEVGPNLWQHLRCSSVFKGGETAWDIDAKVFLDEDNPIAWYCSPSRSRNAITFPYVPMTRRILVKADGTEVPYTDD